LRAYNNTGSQNPVAQWQINWDNPWEVYNFTYSEYGPVLLDPDGAIRHTESREEAEARKDKLTVTDEFKFLLAFALGLRRVRIFEKSTGYNPEATMKVNAGLNKLPLEKWIYYGLTTCSNTEAPDGFHRTVKPVDIWILKHEDFKLECQADRSANQAAKLADIEILPFDRKNKTPQTPIKPKGVTWQKTAVEVKIPEKSNVKTVNQPYEKTSGYFAAKNRCKNKANRAARSKPKRTKLSFGNPALSPADIRKSINHQAAHFCESQNQISVGTQKIPTVTPNSCSFEQIPFNLNPESRKVQYREIFGNVVDKAGEFLEPAKNPPYSPSKSSESGLPSLKRVLYTGKSPKSPKTLDLDYDSDSSLVGFSPRPFFSPIPKEAIDLLPTVSPRSPQYSPEHTITSTSAKEGSDSSSGVD